MTKKNKILLSVFLLTPAIVTSSVILTSCSATNNFVKPEPINLNSSLTKIQNTFNKYLNKLNSMTNFNEVFKYEEQMLEIFNSELFDFNNNVSDVKIDITPEYVNGKLSYSFKYILSFKLGTDIIFDATDNYKFENSQLISKDFSLNNQILNQQADNISFWINEANVVEGDSYSAIKLEQNSFSFIYNDKKYNIESKKTIKTSLVTFKTINIYMNKPIPNTFGSNWFSVDEGNVTQETTHNIDVNIKYDVDPITTLNSESITTPNFIFNIIATKNTFK